ncbi:MAG: UDP-N-acetylmuramoyl-L-alanine--D-glutamate ligase [SAR324 cluster bacterium]|nr:UDP-N-acetylmuramoyl-L-alanine--D-glutamate ligase [SAR324 cluster bacterium]
MRSPTTPPHDLAARLARPVALVGFGVEGRDTLSFLLRHGVSDLAVYDRAWGADDHPRDAAFDGVRFHGDGDWGPQLARSGTVVRSPGVRPDHPALHAARQAGARITSATALFLQACPGPVVGVTGTLGKGTTVSLIEAALIRAGVPCRSGGNIGLNPLSFVDGLTPRQVTVLELSSFQLMDLQGRKPEVAVVLRTSSEHLDWHRGEAEYLMAKRGLLAPRGVKQQVIYCADSDGSRELVQGHLEAALAVSRLGPVRDGIGVEGGRVLRYRRGRGAPLTQLEQLALPGHFNLENAAAAFLATEALGAADGASLAAIAAFRGLPHRLEPVGTVRGVVCYNDSYATRPEATQGAISAFDQALALILGGSEKHADFAPLAEALCLHPSLRSIVLIGATALRLERELAAAAARLGCRRPATNHADSLPAAFAAALEGVAGGGVLLFSPACASFDMFPNYRVRGERFKALVEQAGGGG